MTTVANTYVCDITNWTLENFFRCTFITYFWWLVFCRRSIFSMPWNCFWWLSASWIFQLVIYSTFNCNIFLTFIKICPSWTELRFMVWQSIYDITNLSWKMTFSRSQKWTLTLPSDCLKHSRDNLQQCHLYQSLEILSRVPTSPFLQLVLAIFHH